MAKIPLYQGNERLISESPMAKESPQAAGQGGRDLQVAGEAITQAHNAISQAYDFQQVGSAKLKTLEGVDQIEQKALADGDNTSDLTPYESDLAKLKSDTLKGISNPAARAKFEMDFDLQAAQTRTKVKTIMWTRMKEKGQADTLGLVDRDIGKYGINPDPIYLKNIKTTIDEASSKGFYNAEQAYKLKTAAIDKARESAFIFDRDNNPALAKEKLAKNAYGFNVEKLAKANDVFDREIKKIQGDTEDEILLNDLNGEPTSQQDLITLANQGKIRPEFAKSKIDGLNNLFAKQTNMDTYENIMTMISDPNIKATAIRQKLVDSKNKLTEADYKSLLFAKKLGHSTTVFQEYLQEKNNPNGFWTTAFGILKNFSNVYMPGLSPSALMKNTLDIAMAAGSQAKDLPGIAKQVIMETTKKINPALSSISKNGQVIVDAFGRKGIVYPDGTIDQDGEKASIFEEQD